ncbi:hypothetical protein LEP1GSC043_1025 [Leptospira weilii str. Ecochallenge]|uniref:Uncharacterized protein n=1 Tax=Leptospira weilii str. Ecochallenge TaxID=1049986 RepID=N1U6R4_9LEPT|nr:hypothetical protein LEP1GSC043_1025 [Leptospira weilii str. Ecochallenge]
MTRLESHIRASEMKEAAIFREETSESHRLEEIRSYLKNTLSLLKMPFQSF